MRYIRFIVTSDHDCDTRCTGVVASLRILGENGRLPDYHVASSREIFEKMNSGLPCPPFEEKGLSANCISWFKETAQDWIALFRDITAILEDSGFQVRMLTTLDPGTIVYEDAFQIVARSRRY